MIAALLAYAQTAARVVEAPPAIASHGVPFAYFLNAVVAGGAVALALTVVLWVFWRRAHETSLVAAWRRRFEAAEGEICRLELVLATQPQLVLRWPARDDGEVDKPGSLGDPEILGQGRQFTEVIGRRRFRSGAKLLDAVQKALGDDERSAFISAVTALRDQGEPFTMRLALGDGNGMIAEGRVLGDEVGLWMKEIAPERQEINRLKTELKATERELGLANEILRACRFRCGGAIPRSSSNG